MSFAWSPMALEQLHRLYVQEGRSAAYVARVFGAGLSRNAVLGKVERMGWAHRPEARSGPPAAKLARSTASPARRPPFSRAIPLPRLREVDLSVPPRPWTERQAAECAFPVGEPAEAALQLSCCAPTRRGEAYCPAHRALMTLPDSALTRQDEDAIAEIARRAA